MVSPSSVFIYPLQSSDTQKEAEARNPNDAENFLWNHPVFQQHWELDVLGNTKVSQYSSKLNRIDGLQILV